jgi:hypothetical protein
MKRTHFYLASLMIISAMTGCNNPATTTTATTDSSSTMNPGDSAVTTTTTTTTVHHRYTGSYTPQPNTRVLDLKTHKEVTVRVDTVKGEVVNTETDEPIDLFVDPVKHDTIYGQTGTVVNNYIIKDDEGAYRVDTVRINTVVHDVAPATETGKYKEKDKGNKTKIKSDDSK